MTSVICQFTQRRALVIAYLLLLVSVYITNGYLHQSLILAVIMMTLPIIDSEWKLLDTNNYRKQIFLWMLMMSAGVAIIIAKPELQEFFLVTLFFVAFPEEWFFRSYLMEKIGNGITANIISSICFSGAHLISNGLVPSILVFFPSLIFGWVYQRQRNLITVTLLHAIMNLVYMAYLHSSFEEFYLLFTG